MRRSSSRFTSGRSSTPRTSVKIAAFAPMPSARVSTTVIVSPLERPNDRRAIFKSFRNNVGVKFIDASPYSIFANENPYKCGTCPALFEIHGVLIVRFLEVHFFLWAPFPTAKSGGLPLAPQRNQLTHTLIPQVNSQPYEYSEKHGDYKRRITDANVCGRRATKIAGHQNGSENGRARNQIHDAREGFEYADNENLTFRVSGVRETLKDWCRLEKFQNRAEEHQQHRYCADDAPDPDSLFGNRYRCHSRWCDCGALWH